MTTEHYFPETGHGGGGSSRPGKSIEARTITRRLQELITLRIAARRNPATTTRAQDAFDLRYAALHREIRKQIDDATNSAFGPPRLTPAQRALFLSVLRQKQPLSTTQTLEDIVGGEIVRPRDGDVFEDIETGQLHRARVRWVAVDPDSFFDPEHHLWIEPPKLRNG